MATGISTGLALAALSMLLVTFRQGVQFYQKLLGWLTVLVLCWFYRTELTFSYGQILSGNYKLFFNEFVSLVQIALPIVLFFALSVAFFVQSAIDSGRILLWVFILFAITTIAKVVYLL